MWLIPKVLFLSDKTGGLWGRLWLSLTTGIPLGPGVYFRLDFLLSAFRCRLWTEYATRWAEIPC